MQDQYNLNELSLVSVSINSQLALQVLILAAKNPKSGISSKRLIRRLGVPASTMKYLVYSLEQNGFLCTNERGMHRVCRDTSKIRLLDILTLFDGAFSPVDRLENYLCSTSHPRRIRKLNRLFGEIRNDIIRKFEQTTLQDLL